MTLASRMSRENLRERPFLQMKQLGDRDADGTHRGWRRRPGEASAGLALCGHSMERRLCALGRAKEGGCSPCQLEQHCEKTERGWGWGWLEGSRKVP